MESYSIGEFKDKLPQILESVAQGNSVVLQKGRKREKVAVLIPYVSPAVPARKLGPLSRRGTVKLKSWEIDDDTLLGSSTKRK